MQVSQILRTMYGVYFSIMLLFGYIAIEIESVSDFIPRIVNCIGSIMSDTPFRKCSRNL